MSEVQTRLDSTLLAKAKYDYDKDCDKLSKYGLLTTNHNGGTVDEVTPLMISDAAEARAAEYGKDVKVYVKELEISVKRLTEHSGEEILRSNYQRFEGKDLAEEAVQAENPFAAILSAKSAI